MAIKPYYTSTDLIEAVKRKASIPIAQNTFSEDDILKFANEEMFLAQVPSILEFHEEFLVYEQEVPLLANVSKYPIPNRAIGMKLRDVFYRDRVSTFPIDPDININLFEMSKISPDDRAVFQMNSNVGSNPYHYYLQNNSLVVHPKVGALPVGALLFTYFLRPNSLVLNERAAIIESFSKTLTLDANLTAGDLITIGELVLEAGVDFVIGGTAIITAGNIVAAINTDGTYSASATMNVVLVTYDLRQTVFSTTSTNLTIQETITLNFDQVPDNIGNDGLVDILQTEGGHSMLKFDVKLGSNVVSATSIEFDEEDIIDSLVVGDYVCSQYECIIPQVPNDLHNLLAERTCARILESLGDADGLKITNLKIQEQEARTTNLLDSRVDGSPQKIFNKNSLLSRGGFRRNRKF